MSANVKQAVPFFGVTHMEASLRFYVEGLGFTIKNTWTPEGKIRWCWLELGGAAVMLQEFGVGRAPTDRLGAGVSVCFQCEDSLALYREFSSRNIKTRRRPFVGNGLWVVPVVDPDRYCMEFSSPTDAPEESELEETD